MRDVGWGLWVGRYPEATEVLRDPALGVAASHPAHADPDIAALVRRMPSMHDEPAGRRAIAAVAPLLSPGAVQQRTPEIAETVDALLAEAIAGSAGRPIDLVSGFTGRLAPAVLRDLLGLGDVVGVDELRSVSVALGVELSPQAPAAGRADRVAAIRSLADRLRDSLPRMRHDHPLAPLLRESDPETAAATVLLVASGGQETVSALTCQVLLALRQPDLLAAFGADPVAVVDEVARLQPPIRVLARRAVSATDVAGTHVPAGKVVLIDLARALRDPQRFADPDEPRPGRPGDPGLAFGMGSHRCVGRPLARVVVPQAVAAVLRAWREWPPPDLVADGEPAVPVFSGPTRLLVPGP